MKQYIKQGLLTEKEAERIKKEKTYLNNLEKQFRVIENALLKAKAKGLKKITLDKNIWQHINHQPKRG